LNNVLQETLEPIRNKRIEFSKDIPSIYKILEEGSIIAEKKAAQTLSEIKNAMKINYFADKELIENQSKRFQNQ